MNGDSIDLSLLEEACSFFVGTHFFKNFVRVNNREVNYNLFEYDIIARSSWLHENNK